MDLHHEHAAEAHRGHADAWAQQHQHHFALPPYGLDAGEAGQQPLLPPDGPLLAPQHPGQLHAAELADLQGLYPLGHLDAGPLQQWISLLGHGMPQPGGFPAALAQHALPEPAAAAKSPEAPLSDYHRGPSHGTSAFAPLRPTQHAAEAGFAAEARGAQGWGLALDQALPEQHAAFLHGHADQAPVGAGGQHGFSQLVRQAARGQQPQGEGPAAAAAEQPPAPIRPQPHRPPQATKSSRFRGVYRRQRGGRWEASIVLDGKNCRLGLHLSEVAAARAYDRVAIKKWGPEGASGKVNFPVGQYDCAQLAAMALPDLVAAVRAEWRTCEGAEGGGELPLPEQPAAKRARLEQPPPGFAARGEVAAETAARVPAARSSMYRGVSTHKQSGKWVAQIKAHGKQVYLGFYTDQADAARAFDQAAIHLQGEAAETNFPLEEYADRLAQLQAMALPDLVAALKQHGRGGVPRQPKGEASRFRGVAPDKARKWRAQITTGAKTTVYLGLWAGEEGAARAYDRANLARRGESAKTNFPLEQYAGELPALCATPWEDLVKQLRAEGMATVAADRAARRQAGLAPLPPQDPAPEPDPPAYPRAGAGVAAEPPGAAGPGPGPGPFQLPGGSLGGGRAGQGQGFSIPRERAVGAEGAFRLPVPPAVAQYLRQTQADHER